jgi:hypothetical protein
MEHLDLETLEEIMKVKHNQIFYDNLSKRKNWLTKKSHRKLCNSSLLIRREMIERGQGVDLTAIRKKRSTTNTITRDVILTARALLRGNAAKEKRGKKRKRVMKMESLPLLIQPN